MWRLFLSRNIETQRPRPVHPAQREELREALYGGLSSGVSELCGSGLRGRGGQSAVGRDRAASGGR
jgi:hypothetical protein